MARSTRSQNADAGPSQSQSQRRVNGFGSTQLSTQDDEVLQKPSLDDDDDAPTDPRLQWTVDNFESVPVDSQKFISLLRLLKNSVESTMAEIDGVVADARETAVAVEEALPDDEMIEEVQAGLLKSLATQDLLQRRIQAIETISQSISGQRIERTAEAVKGMLEMEYKKLAEEYNARSEWSRFKDNEKFVEFRTAIWEVNHDDEGCPPMSTWLAKGPGDEDDEEIEVGGVTQTFRCPLTMGVFKDACKSTKCGHYYEYAAVIDYIASSARQRGGNVKCPFGGCDQPLTKAMIVKDASMQRRALQYQTRQQQRKDDEEDLGDQSFIEI